MLRPADVQQFHAEIRADRHAFLCRFHGQLHEPRGLLFAGGDELVYLFPVFHRFLFLPARTRGTTTNETNSRAIVRETNAVTLKSARLMAPNTTVQVATPPMMRMRTGAALLSARRRLPPGAGVQRSAFSAICRAFWSSSHHQLSPPEGTCFSILARCVFAFSGSSHFR